jgi:hypothetical protein
MSHLTALLNFVLCLCIVGICVCRLNAIDRRVMLRFGIQYVVMAVSAMAQAITPIASWGLPGWPAVIFAGAVLFMLVVENWHWIDGPPQSITQSGNFSGY